MPNTPKSSAKAASRPAPKLTDAKTRAASPASSVADHGDFPDPSHRKLADLQRTSGNYAVSQVLGTALSEGISIGPAGDRHEQEADRVARRLLNLPGARDGEGGGIQSSARVAAGARVAADGGGRTPVRGISGTGGRALSEADRTFFERGLGTDLGGVRIHTGESADRAARELRADAFALGPNIVFGAGKYAPGSREGRQLLAHELTHVVQQSGGGNPPTIQRQPAKDQKASAQATPEDLIRKAEARARAKPENRTVLFLSATEMVYRLVQLRLPQYTNLISGVSYAAATKGVVVKGDIHAIAIEVGDQFLFAKNDPDYKLREGDLKKSLKQVADVAAAQPAAAGGPGLAGPAAAQAPGPPAAAPAAAKAETPNAEGGGPPYGEFRTAILAVLQEWKDAKEEHPAGGGKKSKEGELFDKIFGSLTSARADSARTFGKFDAKNKPWTAKSEGTAVEKPVDINLNPTEVSKLAQKKSTTYTTCIAFQGAVLTKIGKYGKYAPVIGSTAHTDAQEIDEFAGGIQEVEKGGKKVVERAWNEGSAGKKERPTKGDIYVLADKDSHGTFSHIGYIESIQMIDGVEYWNTIDGGQGKAAQFDIHGTLQKEGAEKVSQNHRQYKPEENLLEGESNQGRKWSWVRGWVNIDRIPHTEKARLDAKDKIRKGKAAKEVEAQKQRVAAARQKQEDAKKEAEEKQKAAKEKLAALIAAGKK